MKSPCPQPDPPKQPVSGAELRTGDGKLVRILDNWLQRAKERAGEQLACRPGCAQCCIGVFAIDRLDALRLQQGLHHLAERDPERAQRVSQRVRESRERIAGSYPGNVETGTLDESPAAEEIFENFGNDEPCPVLDPETLTCDLYASRPMTCRIFGPPVRSGGGLGVCELCFTKATSEEIAAAEVPLEGEDSEFALNRALEEITGAGKTVVAFSLLDAQARSTGSPRPSLDQEPSSDHL